MDLQMRFLGLSVLFASLCLCPAQGQSVATNVDPSLKLHFDFESDFSKGHLLDVSGNGNDGWQFNPTNWITSSNGVFGTRGGYFTRVGVMTNDPPQVYPLTQYIVVTNLDGIEYLTNATFSLWARFDATNNSHNLAAFMDCGYVAAYSWSPTQASNSWTWAKNVYQNYLSFWVYPDLPDGGSWTIVTWPDDTVGGDNESTTRFHLYSVTVDCPGNQVIAYYDGRPYMTNSINLPWIRIYGTASEHWLCIGASSHDGTPQWGDDRYPNDGYFTGAMDDVRIYNRTLSADEVAALYLGYGSRVWNPQFTMQRTDPVTVQGRFESLSGVSYQIEYLQAVTARTWAAWGAPIAGNNGTQTFLDSISGQAMKFYRVRPLP